MQTLKKHTQFLVEIKGYQSQPQPNFTTEPQLEFTAADYGQPQPEFTTTDYSQSQPEFTTADHSEPRTDYAGYKYNPNWPEFNYYIMGKKLKESICLGCKKVFVSQHFPSYLIIRAAPKKEHHATSFYHLSTSCVRLIYPTFAPDMVKLPKDVKEKLQCQDPICLMNYIRQVRWPDHDRLIRMLIGYEKPKAKFEYCLISNTPHHSPHCYACKQQFIQGHFLFPRSLIIQLTEIREPDDPYWPPYCQNIYYHLSLECVKKIHPHFTAEMTFLPDDVKQFILNCGGLVELMSYLHNINWPDHTRLVKLLSF